MKFHIGDKVRIVKYGNLVWIPNTPEWAEYHPSRGEPYSKGKDYNVYDMSPHLIGNEDIVQEISIDNQFTRYALEHSAWYNEEQLEMVEKNNVFKDES